MGCDWLLDDFDWIFLKKFEIKWHWRGSAGVGLLNRPLDGATDWHSTHTRFTRNGNCTLRQFRSVGWRSHGGWQDRPLDGSETGLYLTE